MASRRLLLKSAAGLSVISLTSGLWASRAIAAADLVAAAKAAGEMKVVLAIGSGIYIDVLKETYFDPFTKETGIETVFVEAADNIPLLKAMTDTNTMEWDIVSASTDSVRSPEFANYVEDLGDCSKLPNVLSEGIDGSCLGNAVLWSGGGVGIAYDESVFPNRGMKGWADFWDVKAFPGHRSFPNLHAPWWVLSAALVADGVDPKDVYPLDVDRAFKKLDELRPNIATWWTSGSQSQQLLRTKEVVAAMVWNGRVASLRQEGFPISFVWNGAISDADALGITKGAPHKTAAMALLNYLYSNPKAGAEYVKRLNYTVPNKHVSDFLDAEQASNLPTAPQNWSKMVKADPAWVAENSQKLRERWTAWIGG